jgi:uncharacterized protein DUF3891
VIVTRRAEGLALVTQVEHGRVAGELAAHWGNAVFEGPTPRESVVLAARQHDEGWRAWDARGLLNEVERRPLHFLEIDPDDHVRLYREGAERVRLGDAYSGLLVGMHWTGLYRGRWRSPQSRGRLARNARDESLLDRVVDEEEHRWVEAKKAAWTIEQPRAVFESTLWHHYELLQLWDLLSLYLCVMPQHPSPREGSPSRWGPQLSSLVHPPEAVLLPSVRTSTFGEAVVLRATVVAPTTLVVDPWPFGTPALTVEVEQSIVPDVEYRDSQAALRVIADGRSQALTWTLRSPGTPTREEDPDG